MEFRAKSCCLDRHKNSLDTEQRVPLYFMANNEPRSFEGRKQHWKINDDELIWKSSSRI